MLSATPQASTLWTRPSRSTQSIAHMPFGEPMGLTSGGVYQRGTILRGSRDPRLRIDDELASHAFVLFAAALAARIGIGPRRFAYHIDRKGLILSQFPAILAEQQIQAGRGAAGGAVRKRIDAKSQRDVHGGDVKAHFFACFDVNYRGTEFEILGG